MGLVANVVGATGLVGRELVSRLLDHPDFDKVRIFVRRKSDLQNPKLEEHLIDFGNSQSWAHLVQGDVLFSTLGTTIKKAKSRDKQYLIDYTYQLEFAGAAAANGVECYVLVSSIGADARSSVFYSRIKGQLEDAVALLRFPRLIIFRPSILDGKRREKRHGEKIGLVLSRFITLFIMKSYRPTPVNLLVDKMIRHSLEPVNGYHIFEGKGIFNK